MVAGWRHLSLLELVCPITPWSRAGAASVSPGWAPRCGVGGLGTATSPHGRVVTATMHPMERGWDLLGDAPPASAPQPSAAAGILGRGGITWRGWEEEEEEEKVEKEEGREQPPR